MPTLENIADRIRRSPRRLARTTRAARPSPERCGTLAAQVSQARRCAMAGTPRGRRSSTAALFCFSEDAQNRMICTCCTSTEALAEPENNRQELGSPVFRSRSATAAGGGRAHTPADTVGRVMTAAWRSCCLRLSDLCGYAGQRGCLDTGKDDGLHALHVYKSG